MAASDRCPQSDPGGRSGLLDMQTDSTFGKVVENVRVSLLDQELWRSFYSKTNEMIVTKHGRRMFPTLRTSIQGLTPDKMYNVMLEFYQVDDHKWKCLNGNWTPGTTGERSPHQDLYLHPDSPNFGSHWMKDVVSFNKVKLTNKRQSPTSSQTLLHSLHKYQPRIHIASVGRAQVEPVNRTIGVFSFKETEFIAVTAYQNEAITTLKIQHNPFAKAFQDSRGRHSVDRKPTMTHTYGCTTHALSNQAANQGSCLLSNTNTFSPPYLSQGLSLNSPAIHCNTLRATHRHAPYNAANSTHQNYTAGVFRHQANHLLEWRAPGLPSPPCLESLAPHNREEMYLRDYDMSNNNDIDLEEQLTYNHNSGTFPPWPHTNRR